MAERTRAERRHNNVKKALRKRNLAKEIYYDMPGWEWFNNLHQYSKNKIHCSCGMCTSKTKNKTKRHVHANYDPSYNPSIHDRRQIEKLNYQEEN